MDGSVSFISSVENVTWSSKSFFVPSDYNSNSTLPISEFHFKIALLTHQVPVLPSYRNQSIYLLFNLGTTKCNQCAVSLFLHVNPIYQRCFLAISVWYYVSFFRWKYYSPTNQNKYHFPMVPRKQLVKTKKKYQLRFLMEISKKYYEIKE